jgi:hypothetical protein
MHSHKVSYGWGTLKITNDRNPAVGTSHSTAEVPFFGQLAYNEWLHLFPAVGITIFDAYYGLPAFHKMNA